MADPFSISARSKEDSGRRCPPSEGSDGGWGVEEPSGPSGCTQLAARSQTSTMNCCERTACVSRIAAPSRPGSSATANNSTAQSRSLSVIYCDKVEERVLPILSTIDRLWCARGWKPTQRYERASVRAALRVCTRSAVACQRCAHPVAQARRRRMNPRKETRFQRRTRTTQHGTRATGLQAGSRKAVVRGEET